MKTTCWSSNRASERGRKGKWLERGMVVGARTDWSEYFKNCWSTGIFTQTHLLGLQRMVPKKRKYPESGSCVDENALLMSRGSEGEWAVLVRDDRDGTVTQITTRYSQDMQNTISERTTHRTLKQMVYSSRRPHRVLLLSAKNRKRRVQFTQAHQKLVWWVFDFCCDIQMVGSEFGVKNMKAWIHPALSQRFRLLVV